MERTQFCILTQLKTALIIFLVLASSAFAGPQEPLFAPDSGMEFAEESKNLDVEYIPSRMEAVQEMLKLGVVGAEDFLVDLGSGDGRIVITAARMLGTRGLGVDLNAKLIEFSKRNAVKAGVADLTEFRVQDFFKTDISQADVVTLYVLTDLNLMLRTKLLNELKPGTRIVSQAGHMGEWRPDKIVILDIVIKDRKKIFIYLWTVPAMVAGKWSWQIPLIKDVPPLFFRGKHFLELKQEFQDIHGIVKSQNKQWQIFDSHLKGNRIGFSVASEAADDRIIRQDYSGEIEGNAINGEVTLSGAVEKVNIKWRATREAH